MNNERPIYFQIQYETPEGGVHSDGCTPAGHKFKDGGSFREFAHQLLDEWLNAAEKGHLEHVPENILEGSHLIFGVCSLHEHDSSQQTMTEAESMEIDEGNLIDAPDEDQRQQSMIKDIAKLFASMGYGPEVPD